MEDADKAEFEIQVSIAKATEEELDRFTRQLLSELSELNVDSVELVRGNFAPEGSKGDPIAIGSIVISTPPTILPAVITLAQSWSARGQGRTIKFKGKGIEFERTPEELEKLLTALDKGKKKK